ncbi:MAG: alpha/beta hydrolase, partial [Okeania sp. SIO2H7]|nr:alpha/beta hydrolase [Okeania sp. SIO2H7]
SESYRQYTNDLLVTKDDMVWYWHQYLPSPADGNNPYSSPLFAEDLSNLPPALIISAECDILYDDGKGYSDRLRDAGIPVKFSTYEGTIHAFIRAKYLSQSREAIAEAVAGLVAAFE